MNCRICQQRTRVSHKLRSDTLHQNVQIFYCQACDAYFSEGTSVNYEHVDGFDLIAYYLGYESTIRNRYQKIFTFVETLVSPGVFFDVGTGMGFSLDIAAQRGWSAKGLEPNKILAAHARGRGCEVENGYLTDSISGAYDFILLDNVLEHIPQPTTFLANAAQLLKHSGVMLIAVPPMDWLRKGLSGSDWVRRNVSIPQINIFYDVDQHVNMLSRKAMGVLLPNVGLRLLDVRYHHSLAYRNTVFRGLGLDDGYYFAVRK